LACNKIEDRLEPKHGTIRSSLPPGVDVVRILPEVALGDVSGILSDVALFASLTMYTPLEDTTVNTVHPVSSVSPVPINNCPVAGFTGALLKLYCTQYEGVS
jgi:hypothetical protein